MSKEKSTPIPHLVRAPQRRPLRKLMQRLRQKRSEVSNGKTRTVRQYPRQEEKNQSGIRRENEEARKQGSPNKS